MTGNHSLNRVKGCYGEDLASQFLIEHDYKILTRNYQCKHGEIDIIATKDAIIHFIEVKNRTNDLIPGRFAVNRNKQKRIRNAANFYLSNQRILYDQTTSFDVIEITAGEIEFLENCFY